MSMLNTKPFLGEAPHGVPAPHAHILPKYVYFGVLGVLLFLTVVTVLTAQIDLGPFNLPLAMVIACTKAALVAGIFMHLYWDHKFNLLIFISSLLFLSIFVIVTMLDTEGRGMVIPERQNFRPRDEFLLKQQETLKVGDEALAHPGQPFGKVEWKANSEAFEAKHHDAGHAPAGHEAAKPAH
jgi:cytochrome c oxidase subunit IV